MIRYAVFRLGQFWSLHSSEGWARGYATRLQALQAAFDVLSAARADPEVELLLQDETGFLSNARLDRFMASKRRR